MKKSARCLLAAAALGASLGFLLPSREDPLVASASRVWRLEGPRGRGSAFPVARTKEGRTLFLTAAHVIVGQPEGPFRLVSQDGEATIVVISLWPVPGADVAILGADAGEAPLIPTRAEPVRFGEQLWAVGWSFGHALTFSSGRAGLPIGVSSAAIAPGCSGGPVLDSEGRAVGVSVSIMYYNQLWPTVANFEPISRLLPPVR